MIEAIGSTLVASTYLEMDVRPTECEIDIRRLTFLVKKSSEENNDPLRMVYTEMLK